MSVRRREWKTSKGETRSAWILTYTGTDGKPHIETYKTEREAKARELVVKVGVRDGTHTPHSTSIDVAQAGQKAAQLAT